MDLINWQEPSLHRTAALIIAIPLSWNIIARSEYRNKTVSKIFGIPIMFWIRARLHIPQAALWDGPFSPPRSFPSARSARTGTRFHYFPSFLTFPYRFNDAMEHQPTSDVLDSIPFIDEISYALFAFGGILVLGSYYRLGIRHTYLGTHYYSYLLSL